MGLCCWACRAIRGARALQSFLSWLFVSSCPIHLGPVQVWPLLCPFSVHILATFGLDVFDILQSFYSSSCCITQKWWSSFSMQLVCKKKISHILAMFFCEDLVLHLSWGGAVCWTWLMAAGDMFSQKRVQNNVKQGLLYRSPETMSPPQLGDKSLSRKGNSFTKPSLVGGPPK